jgi:ABC-type branched-subunit amino acid transport system substrate-binding protein
MDETKSVSERHLRAGRASRPVWVVLALAVLGAIAFAGSAESRSTTAPAGTAQVVVTRGNPVEIAFTAATEFPEFSAAFENAIRLAIEAHPAIRGFPIRVNAIETTCFGDNAPTAAAIVANQQNAAVIGHLCSSGFVSALPVYEAAGVVTISGSATGDSLPALAPTVFNRTAVRDGEGGVEWLAQVAALPSVVAWSDAYKARFGTAAPDLAPLYFDAASLLLRRLQQVSRIVDGKLVIDRAELADAVRTTARFQGVTCSLTFEPETGNRVNDPDALARCANG